MSGFTRLSYLTQSQNKQMKMSTQTKKITFSYILAKQILLSIRESQVSNEILYKKFKR